MPMWLAVAVAFAVGCVLTWCHRRAPKVPEASDDADAASVLCSLLEDPREVWVQGKFRIGNAVAGIGIWTAKGMTFVEVNEGWSPSLQEKRRIWKSIQVARKHEMMRRAGMDPRSTEIRVEGAEVLDIRESRELERRRNRA